MGIVADAALQAGAPVVGVIPESLMQKEVGHRGLSELHVVQTMHQRKMMMAERSDSFLALPGGIGTFEELFEMWSWRQLGYHDKPLGLLNTAGYYNELIGFLQSSARRGLMTAEQLALLKVTDDALAMLDHLGIAAAGAAQPDDYSKT